MIDEINSDLNQPDEDINGEMSFKDSEASFSEKLEDENIYCKDDITNDKSSLYSEVEKTNLYNSQLSSIKGEAENIDYTIYDIDLGSIYLNEEVQVEPWPFEIVDYDNDGITELMVKFDRIEVESVLESGENVLIDITGLFSDGTYFSGSDIITVR